MRDALAVFRGTFRFSRRFPRCILPLLLAWCGYAAVTLWPNLRSYIYITIF